MIAEWRSPNFLKQPLQELILLVAIYLALSRGLKLPLIRLLIVIGLVHLFLRHARNAELSGDAGAAGDRAVAGAAVSGAAPPIPRRRGASMRSPGPLARRR